MPYLGEVTAGLCFCTHRDAAVHTSEYLARSWDPYKASSLYTDIRKTLMSQIGNFFPLISLHLDSADGLNPIYMILLLQC